MSQPSSLWPLLGLGQPLNWEQASPPDSQWWGLVLLHLLAGTVSPCSQPTRTRFLPYRSYRGQ